MWEIAKALVIKAITSALLELGKAGYSLRKERVIELGDIKDNLQSGELKIGDKVTVIGDYSEYVPFVNMSSLVSLSKKPKVPPLPTIGTCRVEGINDEYVGALLKEETKTLNKGTPCIPIFFSHRYSKKSIKMLNFTTGSIVEIQGVISPLPTVWNDIIFSRDFFSFDRGDGAMYPFCLKVYDSEPYGIKDEFVIDLWSLVHFHGISMSRTSPEHFTYIDFYSPDNLITENVFPGAFQFIQPDINILNTESVMEAKSSFETFISEFPSIYLRYLRLIDPDGFARMKRHKRLEYVYDATFECLKRNPEKTTILSKKYLNGIDKKHEKMFGHIPGEQLMNSFVNFERTPLAEFASKYPRGIGHSMLLDSIGKIMKEDEEITSGVGPESQHVLEMGLGPILRILGRYIRIHGRDENSFTTTEMAELLNASISPEIYSHLIINPSLFDLTLRGDIKIVLYEGEVRFIPNETKNSVKTKE